MAFTGLRALAVFAALAVVNGAILSSSPPTFHTVLNYSLSIPRGRHSRCLRRWHSRDERAVLQVHPRP